MRAVELRGQRRSAVAGVPGRQLAGHMRQDAARIHFQETVAGDHLDDEEVARRVEIDAKRFLEQRARRRDADLVFGAAGDEYDAVGGRVVPSTAGRTVAEGFSWHTVQLGSYVPGCRAGLSRDCSLHQVA